MDDDHQEWLNNCDASAAAIASLLLLRHADTPDDDGVVAPLFRNRPGQGIPARAGYWAGEWIARTMLQDGTDLRDLLSVKPLRPALG